MGLFDWAVGTATQVERIPTWYFKENRRFKFQMMETADSFLFEKKNGRLRAAWDYQYKLAVLFAGYKKLPSGPAMLIYARDILMDQFNILPEADKPTNYFDKKTNERGLKAWLEDKTKTQQYKRQEEVSKKMAQQTQIILLSIPTGLFGLGVLLMILFNLR